MLQELKQQTFAKYDAFTIAELFNEQKDVKEYIGEEGCFSTIFDFGPHLLTLGEHGSIYADAQRRVRQSAIKCTAVDTTAAGDTFTGYFLHAMLQGVDIQQALRTAAQASAIAVSRPGAGKSIPLAEEVRKALEAAGNA